MEGSPSLVQRFRSIVCLASLTYTFTVLHAIQYSMQNHDSTTQNPQEPDSESTHYSALSSTHDTLATSSSAGTSEKTSRWTDQEISLLLDYVEQNSLLNTRRGINLKKAEFTKASIMIKSKDRGQCQYKWGHVGIFVIIEDFDYLSIFIVMHYLQGNCNVGQAVWTWLASQLWC